jgi:hypothetical protein
MLLILQFSRLGRTCSGTSQLELLKPQLPSLQGSARTGSLPKLPSWSINKTASMVFVLVPTIRSASEEKRDKVR